jgi:hypothetical protein
VPHDAVVAEIIERLADFLGAAAPLERSRS